MIPNQFYPLVQPTSVWTGFQAGWQPIKHYYCGGTKPTRRIVTRRGYETAGSWVHPVWMRLPGRERFQQLREVQPGSYACLSRAEAAFPSSEPSLPLPDRATFDRTTNFYPVPDKLTPELARLLGYIVAEGWTNGRYGVHIAQDQAEHPEIHADIAQLCLSVLSKAPADGQNKDQTLNLSSVYLRAYLQGLGVDQVLSAGKCVPWPIFQGTSESVTAFLRGYFDGEASVCSNVLEVSSASEQLLREVQILLLRFGILSSRNPKVTEGKTYWRLVLCGQDAVDFNTKIGLLTPSKKDALQALCRKRRNANLDVVPFAQAAVQALRAEIQAPVTKGGSNDNRTGSGIKQFGVPFEKTLNNIRNEGRNPTYSFLDQLLQVARQVGVGPTAAYTEVQSICANRFFYDPVVTLQDGEEPVADIEVEDPCHSFVADGFINHNTLQAIAALCYLWEQEPSRKTLVLTTKSATSQWAKEFAKFTRGVRVVVANGDRRQRETAYEAWRRSDKPTVMIMGYRSAVNDLRKIQHDHGFILITDECFQYHTPVTLADGSTELIGRIVTQQMPVEVLSWNPDTGDVEPQKVVHWHRNALQQGKRKSLLHLNFRFGGKVRVTRTHKFYSPDGQDVPATILRRGSEVQHLTKNIPSDDQWQVILGGLLGDSSISHPERPRWGVAFGHSGHQEAYLRFKRDMLFSLGVSEIDNTPNGGFTLKDGGDKSYARFRLCANEAVTSFLVQSRVRRNEKKRVTLDWLDRIGPLGLAIWHADDGSLNEHVCSDGVTRRYITLNTQDFTRDEGELLAGWLRWKWGVNAEVKITKPGSNRTSENKKSYPYIYMARTASDRFLDTLPCGFPGVEYKFPGKPIMDATSFDAVPRQGLITDWLTEKCVWMPPDPDKDKYVYNLEVGGNHNYFANGSLVSNCTAFKNTKTQVHQVVRHLSAQADRTWALTATLIKNHLMEGHGIYQVVVPGLFGTVNQFMYYYCIVEMIQVGGGRKVPRIVGYYPEKVDEFRGHIDPYYLGRPKHAVAEELPVLTRKPVEVGVTAEQEAKYREATVAHMATSATLTVGGKKGEEEEKEVTKLTALIYHQEILDHPALIGCEGESEKLTTLIEMLTEGELEDEKVIIYTRFSKMVDLLMPELEKAGLYPVRVTGSESGDQRQKAQDTFQHPDSPCKVICITSAGGEAINRQAAKAIVFYDTPWSAGEYLQVLGRMIRIGSAHDRVLAIHLVAKIQGLTTVDTMVMEVIEKKLKLIEAVLGERLKGGKDAPTEILTVTNEINELFDALKAAGKL